MSMVATRMAPSIAPRMLPEPPKTFTPPITTAVTTANSNPVAEVASTPANRAANMNPPSPASVPLSMKAASSRRPIGIPVNRAASGFDPMA